jgi:hypothetical protein
MTTHTLKVEPPYFEALVSGAKTFEVRKNDRAFQRGDVLELREWHPDQTNTARPCTIEGCDYWYSAFGHWAECREIVERRVSFVYAGDPRFGGIEPGYVVLGLARLSDTEETQQ